MTKTRDLTDNRDFWSNMEELNIKEGSTVLCSLCDENKSDMNHEEFGDICQECLDNQHYCEVCALWYSKDDPCIFH